jgi:hypothetical protein
MTRWTERLAVVITVMAACADPDVSTSTRSTSLIDVGSPPSYPNGPYGFGVGNTIPNLKFQGKSGFGSGQSDLSLRPISLADYQRHGTTETKVLVIIACATWCAPCQQEQPALNDLWAHYNQTNPGEVVFVTAMIQNGTGHTATEHALDNWSHSFSVPYDLVLDPTASVMQTMDPNEEAAFPVHLVVRTRNMRITQRSVGASNPRSAIDAILASPNDPNDPPPAPAGTIYPGPASNPDCSEPNACEGSPPAFTCYEGTPGSTPGTYSCRETGAFGSACGWRADPCPLPVGVCPEVDCGPPPPPPPPNTCDDGTSLSSVCFRFSNGTCLWGSICGGSPPPPPPPPVDCYVDGACGPDPDPISCPEGSTAEAVCVDFGGFCGWDQFCRNPPIDCSPAGSCPGPAPTDVCEPPMTGGQVCMDFGGFCDWGLQCSGGTK